MTDATNKESELEVLYDFQWLDVRTAVDKLRHLGVRIWPVKNNLLQQSLDGEIQYALEKINKSCQGEFPVIPEDADPEEKAADELRTHLVRFRQDLRSALYPFWANNPGVGEDEIVDAVRRAVNELVEKRKQQ